MSTDFNEINITDAVQNSISNTPDMRTRQISSTLVSHLHSFVREICPSQEEWRYAIEFLTKVGQKCDDNRQEFILLSDTLGVSMLVDVLNNRPTDDVTESTVLGPFYVKGPPEFPLGSDISKAMDGEPLYVSGSVRSAAGDPLVGAIVDVWHSDKDGYYDVQQLDDLDGAAMRARFRTDKQGRFCFWTIKPAPYPIPHDGPVGKMLEAQKRHPWRPAHVHFWIEAPKHHRLVTHVFLAGDPYLESDVVFAVKQSLICTIKEYPPGIAPDGRPVDTNYAWLNYDFSLLPT